MLAASVHIEEVQRKVDQFADFATSLKQLHAGLPLVLRLSWARVAT